VALHRSQVDPAKVHASRISNKMGKPNLAVLFDASGFFPFAGRLHTQEGCSQAWDLRNSGGAVPFWNRGDPLRRFSTSPQQDFRRPEHTGAAPPTNHGGTGWHYPHLGAFEISGTGIPATDGTGFAEYLAFGRMTTTFFAHWTGTGGWAVRLYVAIPEGFGSFVGFGIRWANRAQVVDVTPAERQTLSLEVMDPSTGGPFSTPKKSSRTPTASEAGFSWLALSPSVINGAYTPGQLMVIELAGVSTGAGAVNISLGAQIEIDWSSSPAGGGFGGGGFGEDPFGGGG